MRKNCNLPNFFIVGAAMAGISSLLQYLKNHPEVFMPEDQKEPRFFNRPERISLIDYLKIFESASSRYKRIGKASTAYSYDAGSRTSVEEKYQLTDFTNRHLALYYTLISANEMG